MKTTSIEKTREDGAAALKVGTRSLLVLELHSSELTKINRQLLEKEQQGREFFRSTPLLLDLKNLDAEVNIHWLKEVHKIMLSHSFIPVGIASAPTLLQDAARKEEIAVWSPGKADHPESEIELPPTPPEKVKEEVPQPLVGDTSVTKVIEQPVRSGQRVYAEGGDLIVMSSVNTGAEVMADGHIHVYGSLRGRAFAGAKGWEGARIFCSNLNADLVAVAGIYTINEDLPEEHQNSGVKISLHEESLHFEPLNP